MSEVVVIQDTFPQISSVNSIPQIQTTDHNTTLESITQAISLQVDNIPDMYMDVYKVPIKR